MKFSTFRSLKVSTYYSSFFVSNFVRCFNRKLKSAKFCSQTKMSYDYTQVFSAPRDFMLNFVPEECTYPKSSKIATSGRYIKIGTHCSKYFRCAGLGAALSTLECINHADW